MANGRRFPRKDKTWFGTAPLDFLLTANSTSFGTGMSAGLTSTIMRIMGEYAIGPTSAPTALDAVYITLALGIVSSDAFTLGSTAAPDPVTEFGYPWLYWRSHGFHFSATDPEAGTSMTSVRHSFDVKGMRKLRVDQTLAWVVQYSDSIGAPPMSIALAGTRILLAN